MSDHELCYPPQPTTGRTPPCLVVLDDQLNVVSAESRYVEFIADMPPGSDGRLPILLEREVRRLIDQLTFDRSGAVALVASQTLLRVVRLDGPSGSCIALTLERFREREPIAAARGRYRLTPRESQVLTFVLEGLSAKQIGQQLCISTATVQEYFKHLTTKTGASNRAEMIARVLGWAGTRESGDRATET